MHTVSFQIHRPENTAKRKLLKANNAKPPPDSADQHHLTLDWEQFSEGERGDKIRAKNRPCNSSGSPPPENTRTQSEPALTCLLFPWIGRCSEAFNPNGWGWLAGEVLAGRSQTCARAAASSAGENLRGQPSLSALRAAPARGAPRPPITGRRAPGSAAGDSSRSAAPRLGAPLQAPAFDVAEPPGPRRGGERSFPVPSAAQTGRGAGAGETSMGRGRGRCSCGWGVSPLSGWSLPSLPSEAD